MAEKRGHTTTSTTSSVIVVDDAGTSMFLSCCSSSFSYRRSNSCSSSFSWRRMRWIILGVLFLACVPFQTRFLLQQQLQVQVEHLWHTSPQQASQQKQEQQQHHYHHDDADIVHVLYALSGSHPGFMDEFEVSLKSVLGNAPLDDPLHIHLMVDDRAWNGTIDVLQRRSGLMRTNDDNFTSYYDDGRHSNSNQDTTAPPDGLWRGRIPTRIFLYPTELHHPQWFRQIMGTLRHVPGWGSGRLFQHTVGTYYRLFAGQVLPSNINRVLYLDSDAIVISPLDGLWNVCCRPKIRQGIDTSADAVGSIVNPTHQVVVTNATAITNETGVDNEEEEDDDIMFMWGETKCAGFMILNPQKINQAWPLFASIAPNVSSVLGKQPGNDQTIFMALQRFYPHLHRQLPLMWDVHAVGNVWARRGTMGKIAMYRPSGAGFLHFNGGAETKEAFFTYHYNYRKTKHWGLAQRYVNMPWYWAQAYHASRLAPGESGYPVTFTIVPSTNSTR